MIRFYLNRELAQRLDINLSRWKRWSREFLPPDPLGGLQSGYARQYNLDDAFCVYLGGFLVANLKYSIPETKTILRDLKDWLAVHGAFYQPSKHAQKERRAGFGGKNVRIHIFQKDKNTNT